MKTRMGFVAVLVAVFGFCALGPAAYADGIWWQNKSGTTGSYPTASWSDLQGAITSALGGSGGTGEVRISGNVTRTSAGDAGLVIGRDMKISGGWNSGFSAQTGTRSTIDPKCADLGSNIRILYTSGVTGGYNITLDSLVLTGGRATGTQPGYGPWGGALYSNDGPLQNFRMNNVRITDNQSAQYAGGITVNGGIIGGAITNCEFDGNKGLGLNGGAIFCVGLGTVAAPTVFKDCAFSNNTAVGHGGAVYCGEPLSGQQRALFANCRFTGNSAGAGNQGAALFLDMTEDNASKGVIFGCLFTDNGTASGQSIVVTPVTKTANGMSETIIANTTFAENKPTGYLASKWSTVTEYMVDSVDMRGLAGVTMVNSILANDRGVWVGQQNNGYVLHMQFQNSTFLVDSGDGFVKGMYNVQQADTLAGALALVNSYDGLNFFHSLTATPDGTPAARSQNAEGNLNEAPGFLGSGADPYQLAAGSGSLNNALLRTADVLGVGNGVLYVDINYDGDYDALLDVIVDLAGNAEPSSGHFVVTTDLLGQPRLSGTGLDRGGYEYLEVLAVPEPATLGLLGLALLGLRKRRS